MRCCLLLLAITFRDDVHDVVVIDVRDVVAIVPLVVAADRKRYEEEMVVFTEEKAQEAAAAKEETSANAEVLFWPVFQI